jgi:hypothetical protein
VIAHGRRTDSPVGTAIGPSGSAIYHGGELFVSMLRLVLLHRPALSPGSVDSCATHLGRLFPPLFLSPDRPCLFPDPPLLISFICYTIISPRTLFATTPPINPRHYLFPIFISYHLPLSTISIISSRSPCRPTLSHYALMNIV